MDKEGVNSLSLITHYLRMIPYSSDKPMSTGTGFIFEYDSKYYLITNGHNITRVNPDTNKRIIDSAAFPVKIATKVKIQKDNHYHVLKDLIEIDLYEDLDFKIPKWFVHPKHKYRVDVVAIPIEETKNVHESIKLFPINKIKFDAEFSIRIADDVYVLGYPFDLTSGMELPIWKRGSIATEPIIDLDNLPKLMIDTATRSGMSGSPVIMFRSGFHSLHDGNALKGDEIMGTIKNFVGIYSGRIGAEDNFLTQLGIVWKERVINEILEAQTIGDIEFQAI